MMMKIIYIFLIDAHFPDDESSYIVKPFDPQLVESNIPNKYNKIWESLMRLFFSKTLKFIMYKLLYSQSKSLIINKFVSKQSITIHKRSYRTVSF